MHADLESLYEEFRRPSPLHGPRPFWFWNGPMDEAKVEHQMREMMDKGVFSAYVFPWSGMRPQYFTDEWWSLVRTTMGLARDLGFGVYFINEYMWPAGHARDMRVPGLSRVLEVRPEARMRSLFPEVVEADDGAEVTIDVSESLQCAFVAQRLPSGHLDAATIQDVTRQLRQAGGLWRTPAPGAILYAFRLAESIGLDGGLVDFMSKEAMRTYIDLVYEQYLQHFGEYFGDVFRGTRLDHNGDYGYRLAWTPALFDEFRQRKGYDLEPKLPLLLEEGGAETPVVRCDYFDVVGALYREALIEQVAEWSAEHGLEFSGHLWEENLHAEVALAGEGLAVQRAFGHPSVDTLLDFCRSPRHFKVAASVAHFEHLPFEVEHQELSGIDSCLSPEVAKREANMIGVWAGSVFVPGSFYANPLRVDYPDQGFEAQPWWPYYRHYSEYVSRLSYMNTGGRHVCDIALYHPIESMWPHGNVVFDSDQWNYSFIRTNSDRDHGVAVSWGNYADHINAVYGQIMESLPRAQRDLDIIDAHYLAEGTFADGRLRIADESYGVLVLPPMTCIKMSSARRIRELGEGGVQVVAVERLPTDSMENGRDCLALKHELDAAQVPVMPDTDALLAFLDRRVPRDIEIVRGDARLFYYLHWRRSACDVYFFVNDSARDRQLRLRVTARGRPERWDPDGGSRTAIAVAGVEEQSTELDLTFTPWEAYYVVFAGEAADSAAERPPTVIDTTLSSYSTPERRGNAIVVRGDAQAAVEIHEATVVDGGHRFRGHLRAPSPKPYLISGPWQFEPQAERVHVSWARTRTSATGTGEALRWEQPTTNDHFWPSEWISAERFTLRDWWLLGPFDGRFGGGYHTVYPPERGIELGAEYQGAGAATLRWSRYRSDDRIVRLTTALGVTGAHKSYQPSGQERALGEEARANGAPRAQVWTTYAAFALTHVHVPEPVACELRVTADSNFKAWLNDELLATERDDPAYNIEMRDGWGQKVAVRLERGWNRLLLKVSQAPSSAGHFGFVARFCDQDGQRLSGLTCAASPVERFEDLSAPQDRGERWYRMPVPPGTGAVELPVELIDAVYLDGEQVQAAPVVEFAPCAQRLLALRMRGAEELPDKVHFIASVLEDCPLGSWSYTGLSFFSGSAVYETTFEPPRELVGQDVDLDLGSVGVACDVWLNGKPLGQRVWRPYRFDVSNSLQPGRNTLRVEVANTRSNERAGGAPWTAQWDLTTSGPDLLDALEENGLLGPVCLMPRAEVEIECRPDIPGKAIRQSGP